MKHKRLFLLINSTNPVCLSKNFHLFLFLSLQANSILSKAILEWITTSSEIPRNDIRYVLKTLCLKHNLFKIKNIGIYSFSLA